MPVFNSFSNVLPDPIRKITDQGDIDASGVAGPGFAGVHFSSNSETQVSRTNSGRGVQRDQETQFWSFSIKYNPMFRAQFDPVDAFLASRNGRRNPFFVVLPQYSKPKDSAFATFATSNIIRTFTPVLAGARSLMIDAVPVFSSTPKPNDMFTITDPANANHLKMYKITRVETNLRYQAGSLQPTTNQLRIHVDPPIQRATTEDAVINFINPMFRVIQRSDIREHDLDTNNLYSFSLDLEEIQP